MTTDLPKLGQWPVNPQEDQPILDSCIWIDGCFDFFHHGHAGVMLQARQLGDSLHVGIHSDEAILANKGPPVMNLAERVAAADACRWVTQSIPHAPYVTDLAWISHYGCRYVVHGDDITSDAGGEDCYRFVKQANRFKVVKRTPGISTTDLVGRMLLGSREHFIPSLRDMIKGDQADGPAMRERLNAYASDASGLAPGVNVYMCSESSAGASKSPEYSFESFITGTSPHPGQRIVYVDGGFDLFCSGHISFLLSVVRLEEKRAKAAGWSHSYSPCHVVAGIHDDLAINAAKGENYPIMNIYERGLCLLQCKYVNTVIFSAPPHPSSAYLQVLPYGLPAAVYHGSTTYMPITAGGDPYADAKALGIFEQVPKHDFQDVDASTIVARIMDRRDMFVDRQRRKEGKATVEAEVKRKEAGV